MYYIIIGNLLCDINNILIVMENRLCHFENTMNKISRRQFLQGAGAAVAAVTLLTLPALGGTKSKIGQKRVRVRPLASQANLRPGEISFYRRARFSTAADAMRAVASRGIVAEVYKE